MTYPMTYPKQITSNKRHHTYILNRTALIDNANGFVLLRKDLKITLAKIKKAKSRTIVQVHHISHMVTFGVGWRDDKKMFIGCRTFNRTTSELLRVWAEEEES